MQFSTITAILASLALTATAAPSPNANTNAGPGARAAAAAIEKRYVTGQCGVHITQYQKNEGPGGDTSKYRFDVTIKDAAGGVIGGVQTATIDDGGSLAVSSELPYQFIVSVGNVDEDSVSFAYAGQSFSSSSGQCGFGGYEDGNRDGDCGFSC